MRWDYRKEAEEAFNTFVLETKNSINFPALWPVFYIAENEDFTLSEQTSAARVADIKERVKEDSTRERLYSFFTLYKRHDATLGKSTGRKQQKKKQQLKNGPMITSRSTEEAKAAESMRTGPTTDALQTKAPRQERFRATE